MEPGPREFTKLTDRLTKDQSFADQLSNAGAKRDQNTIDGLLKGVGIDPSEAQVEDTFIRICFRIWGRRICILIEI
jgi:hypothetical protein